MDDLTGAADESPKTTVRRPSVNFIDSNGNTWTVFEVAIPEADWTDSDRQSDLAGYGVGWLCFRSDHQAKRLRLYRKAWHRLPETELAQLCRRALRTSSTGD